MKKETVAVRASKKIRIVVDGGYQPDHIEVQHGSVTVLEFLRKDPSTCLEEVVFPDFQIRQFLPIGVPVQISLNPSNKGTYSFQCGMSMFFGKITVV